MWHLLCCGSAEKKGEEVTKSSARKMQKVAVADAGKVDLERELTARSDAPLMKDTAAGTDTESCTSLDTRTLLWGLAMLVFVPMPFCIAPILVPFGGTHHMMWADIWTLLEKEWVYCLWYSPIGWASLYGSMSLWTARCLDIDSGVAPDSLYGAFMGTVLPTVLTCTLFILAGLWVFPTPLATVSVGTPSVFIWCICVYLATPTEWMTKANNRWRLLAILLYWMLWLVELALLTFFTYLCLTLDETHFFGICTFTAKIALDKATSSAIAKFHPAVEIITEDLLTEEGRSRYRSTRKKLDEFGMPVISFLPLWMDYAIVVYQSFIFPVGGRISTMILLILAGNLYQYRAAWQIEWTSLLTQEKLTKEEHPGYHAYWHYLAPARSLIVEEQLERFFRRELCECFAPVHFAFIFAFDVFLWNKNDMYHICNVTDEQAVHVLTLLAATAGTQFCCAAIQIHGLLNAQLAEYHKDYLRKLIVSSCREWIWLLISATASIATIAGACMIMKHDGMDMALEFSWMK
eukprot:TRINITY_DN10298_c0_g4_i1.p1 TRINITY_DN10298_c0_g4~~TRINITY_DN10298_c0_g4_i1.p1  ORF type:complete len:519 (+),score=68.36 TRINITY_DN10298_c0_g4_i1:78-1634(+)